ncbi:MAG: hypothetical protein WA949_23810 [Phormidesmis sp.]
MTHSTIRDRQHLEQLWRVPPTPHKVDSIDSPISCWVKSAGRSLVDFFTDSQQLRIWTKKTPTDTLWFAYDPATEQTISHTSERGLRAWLEQRHHQ